ncbi:hypothetical protein DCC24_09950 [Auritidibacter sp. NML100628]|nr:hypothetical protein DCC24_09950 [Auritidibacter sp. NML100628]
MKTPDLSEPRVRRRLIAVLVVVVLASVGIYGLLVGPPDQSRGDGDCETPGPVLTAPSDPVPTTTPRLPVVRASDDPETFARNVAIALFEWDTGSGFMPLDYTSVVLDVGNLTGAEQAGLAYDIAAYLPSRDAWLELRQYATTQHLNIDNTFIPDAWGTAVEQAQPGQLADGTVAVTIEGTLHRATFERHGELGQSLATAGPVAVNESWSRLRTDSAHHAVLRVSEWPRSMVYPGFLSPVLLSTGIQRSFSLICTPLRSDQAARDIRKKKVGHISDAAQRAKIGQIEDAAQTAEYHDVLQQEADLTAGHGVLRYTGLISVSAPTVEELEAGVATIEQAAIQASCETRLLVEQQAAAFTAAALPLCRSV